MRRNNKRLYESIIRDVSKVVKKHLNEVSKEMTDRAFQQAKAELMQLTNEVTKDNFTNKNLVNKLCRRLRQANVFKEYSDKLNAMAMAAAPARFARCIQKWKDKGIKVGREKITPIFMLSGFDEKDFITILDGMNGPFLAGTGNYDEVTVYKKNKPYKISKERVVDPVNTDHKILPTQVLVIIPGTEEFDLDNKNIDKRSSTYRQAKKFLDQLLQLQDELYEEFGNRPEYDFERRLAIRKSKMSTPSDWSDLKKYASGEALEKILQTNMLSEIFPDKDGVIFMTVNIPKALQKEFDMEGAILLTKDELKHVDMEYLNNGYLDDEANVKKYGKYASGKHSMYRAVYSGRVRADRYGKEI